MAEAEWTGSSRVRAVRVLDPNLSDEDILRIFEESNVRGLQADIDIYGASFDKLDSGDFLRDFSPRLCEYIAMEAFGPPLVQRFGKGILAGWTIIQAIETSNFAGHCWQHDLAAAFSIHSCAPYAPHKTARFIMDAFDASHYEIQVSLRCRILQP